MNIRSTDAKHVHFGGHVWAGVESSVGVSLIPGSSLGFVEPIGDAAEIPIQLRGKSTGYTRVGSSVSNVAIAGSTTYISGVDRYLVQFTEPDLAGSTVVVSTYTVSGVTTNASFVFTPRTDLEDGYTIGAVYCSTADELKILWSNGLGSTNSGSSNRGTLLQISY